MKQTLLLLCGCVLLASCTKEAARPSFEGFVQPPNFPVPVYRFNNNNITSAGFELGRKLFYDPLLSGDNTISCGSCHQQSAAFTHHGHTVSHGIHDRLGTRNSPAIMNLAWYRSFMWDGGVFDLDLQPVAPITNPVEMDETVGNVIKKLEATAGYPQLFGKAFGSQQITSARLFKALSQFMLLCVSSNSKYDSVKRSQAKFTQNELRGYELFASKCASCHTEPLFTDNSFRNNGLTPAAINDQGRYAVTLQQQDKYLFKVPTLRNLAYTAPYMHDGRFLDIETVLEHYNANTASIINLDSLLHTESKPGIRISKEEKQLLLAFLNTLNDKTFITNKTLSEQ